MRACELCVGNYYHHVQDGGFHVYRVHDFDSLASMSEDYEEFNPILITEEWLVDFGFVNTSEYKYLKGDFFFCFKTNVEQIRMKGQPIKIKNRIKYIHQLQNLYFCLIGEELVLQD